MAKIAVLGYGTVGSGVVEVLILMVLQLQREQEILLRLRVYLI